MFSKLSFSLTIIALSLLSTAMTASAAPQDTVGASRCK
jgi:hypothetical protein